MKDFSSQREVVNCNSRGISGPEARMEHLRNSCKKGSYIQAVALQTSLFGKMDVDILAEVGSKVAEMLLRRGADSLGAPGGSDRGKA
jgi:hypothetical protein